MTKQEALIVIGLIKSQLEEQISKLDIVSKSDFDEYLSNIEIKENTITKIVNQIFSKLEELENRKIEIPSYENIKNDIMQFVEANMPKDGINGLNGEDGRDGKDGVNGLDGKDGLNGKDGKDGKNGKDGLNGKDGKDGRDGVDGKDGKNGLDGKDGTVPDHEITGRMIRFKKPNGEWGEYIKLISRGGGVAKGGGVSYYTNLNPVPNKVGGIDAGTTFENMDITAVLDMLLYPFSASFSITPTTATMGQTVTTIDMTFSVSDSTATMEISNGVGDVTGTISYSLSGIFIADTSFTLTATKDSNTATINKSLIFLNYVYSGVTPNTAPIESEILASSKTLSNTKNKTVTYDCTGGNRFYIAYPQRMGTMSAVKVNGLPFNGYTVTTATITNEYSFSEVYTIYTSNNLVYGSAIPVIWS